ncbi:MAG: hypothetical protein IKH57_02505 [Clostridia bacterium]|nr:hypothetical protein [Clostridia bacterium]
MKKIFALILTLCMAFSLLFAYAEETQTPAETDVETKEIVTETQPEAEPQAEPQAEPKAEAADSLEDVLSKLFSKEEGTAENAVLGFLGELDIDTAGYEEKISQAVSEVKNSVSGLFDTAKEKAGSWMNKLGEGLDSLLADLNTELEQTKSSAASQAEELRALLEKLVKEAAEQDPESELTKALTELLENVKGIAKDNIDALTDAYNKLVEIILTNIQ